MTRDRRRYNNVLKELNGMTVTYTDNNNLTWKCIVLAAPGKGLSFKPLCSPKYMRKKVGPSINTWIVKPEDPKFCVFRAKTRGVKNHINVFENLIKTKKLNNDDFNVNISAGAFCPF